MKKHIYKIVIAIISVQTSWAQYVTIPDANFRIHLKTLYPNCFNSSNQLDTNCSGVRNATIIEAPSKNIANLDGIQYFDNLIQLFCAKNALVSLAPLPSKLEEIDCGENQLNGLPKLPNSLRHLICPKNKLTSLPTLPPSLTVLNVESNLLTELSNLPSTIVQMYCRSNKLTALPALPTALVSLYCASNDLTSLPQLPSGLIELVANGNCFSTIPANPKPQTLILFTVSPNKTNCTLGIEDENTTIYVSDLYPNPFSISISTIASGRLKIYTTDGTEVMNTYIKTGESLVMPQLSAGLYYYHLNGKKGKIVKNVE